MALQSISHWGMFDVPGPPIFSSRNLWTGEIIDPDKPGALDLNPRAVNYAPREDDDQGLCVLPDGYLASVWAKTLDNRTVVETFDAGGVIWIVDE